MARTAVSGHRFLVSCLYHKLKGCSMLSLFPSPSPQSKNETLASQRTALGAYEVRRESYRGRLPNIILKTRVCIHALPLSPIRPSKPSSKGAAAWQPNLFGVQSPPPPHPGESSFSARYNIMSTLPPPGSIFIHVHLRMMCKG